MVQFQMKLMILSMVSMKRMTTQLLFHQQELGHDLHRQRRQAHGQQLPGHNPFLPKHCISTKCNSWLCHSSFDCVHLKHSNASCSTANVQKQRSGDQKQCKKFVILLNLAIQPFRVRVRV